MRTLVQRQILLSMSILAILLDAICTVPAPYQYNEGLRRTEKIELLQTHAADATRYPHDLETLPRFRRDHNCWREPTKRW